MPRAARSFSIAAAIAKNRENVSDFAPENDANQRVGRRALVLDEFVAQRHTFALRAGENRPNRANRTNQQHESRESGE